jgi:hypothetical protein
VRFINLFGNVPGVITENTPPWDWLGQLRLSIDPGLIRFVDIIGSGADFFDAALNRQLGTIVLTPIARPDHEAFARAGQDAGLSLTFRFFMMDGTIAESTQPLTITVLDVDDTPPQSLSLATTGAVPFGVAGVSVGTLAVSDPDTRSGFTYTIREDDRWQFEVVGNTLRLKEGIRLSEADGPIRAVTIDVSDGTQSAAYTVSFSVTDPRAPNGQLANLLIPGAAKSGFLWRDNNVLIGNVMSSDIRAINDYGKLLNIVLDNGDSLWVNQPLVLDLLDGRILYGADAGAPRIWSLYETIANREPTLKEMQSVFNWMDTGGGSEAVMRQSAMREPQFQALSNTELVRSFYQNSVGWVDQGGLNYHVARLDAGLPREQLLFDFMNWRRGLGHEAERADHGIFVPRATAHEVDILLDIGAGIPSGEITRWWIDRIADGTTTISFLAWAVTTTDGWKNGMGRLSPATFTSEFYGRALGTPMDPQAVSVWATALGNGATTPQLFMEAVARGATMAQFSTSYVFDRPQADSFGAS